MAETVYNPYADSDIGTRAFGGEHINSMNFYWFNPNTQEVGSTTEGWSRVPDEHKRYTYLNPGARDAAETKFFQSGASGIGVGGKGGNNLLSGLNFARSIAGGEAAPSMIAPGMSYSMDQPMGYTAEGASRVPFPSIPVFEEQPFYAEPAPVLNLGTGQGAYDPIPNQMPYAPPGVTIGKIKELLEARPQTVSPLGSLDTTYLNDIDFSGLLNTPEPQVGFPVAPPEVVESTITNQPIYQDPILDMVKPVAEPVVTPILDMVAPVVNNEIVATDTMPEPTYQDPIVNLVQDLPTNDISVTDIVPEPSYPSLGASLFDNETIIPAAPEPTPLVDVQEVLNSLGLLNETPSVSTISKPLDFNTYERVPDVNIQMPNLLANSPVQVQSPEPVEVADSIEEIIQQITTPSLPIQAQLPIAAPVAVPTIAPVPTPETVNSVVTSLLDANPQLDFPIAQTLIPEVAPQVAIPTLNARGGPLTAQQQEEHDRLSKNMADAMGYSVPVAPVAIKPGTAAINIPTYNYNDPARLARIEAYFAR